MNEQQLKRLILQAKKDISYCKRKEKHYGQQFYKGRLSAFELVEKIEIKNRKNENID